MIRPLLCYMYYIFLEHEFLHGSPSYTYPFGEGANLLLMKISRTDSNSSISYINVESFFLQYIEPMREM